MPDEPIVVQGPGDLVRVVPRLVSPPPEVGEVLVIFFQDTAVRACARISAMSEPEQLFAALSLGEIIQREGADAAAVLHYRDNDDPATDRGGMTDIGAAISQSVHLGLVDEILVGPTRFVSTFCDDESCCPATGLPIEVPS